MHTTDQAYCVERLQSGTGYFSVQAVHQQPSCLALPICTNGSSISLLAPRLQTDYCNRNTQWSCVLCQHCCTVFLPANSLLSVFISWVNLDFGIETCFYNGLDTYSKTWLQFVFPVYLWVLVGLMIIVSHYSHRFAKLLGNNPVSVLATLFLLSYTKILRTLIAVMYITYLEYPTYNNTVYMAI